jgi:hypothetical protein
MEKTKYRKYISKEIIEESKYPQITAPIVKYRGDRGGRDMTFEWSCITNPLVMDDEPEVNEFDQFMLFASSNIDDYSEFQAQVELPLGKEKKKQIINEPQFVYIPQGLVHGPVKFKNIKKPIVFMNIYLSPKYSKKWVPSDDYGKYLAKPIIMKAGGIMGRTNNIGPGGVMGRYQLIPQSGAMMAWCKALGLEGNICMGYNTNKYPSIGFEPRHYHRNFDQWLILLGGDPLNVEDFDAEVQQYFGEENGREILDSTSVTHMPPGLIHYSTDVRIVKKPFINILLVSTGDYFGVRPKVIVSKEEEGDIMLGETRQWESDLFHPPDCTCTDCVFARTQSTP